MSVKATKFREADLTEEAGLARHEAAELARYREAAAAAGTSFNEAEAKKKIALNRPPHQCPIPTLDPNQTGLGIGSVFTCDSCGRQKQLDYLGYTTPDGQRWIWRNLPHARDARDSAGRSVLA